MEAATVRELAGRLSGRVVGPDDAEYDAIRRVHNGMVDRRPASIVRCQNTADVSDAVRLARRQGLEISVRGGGHNVAGTAVCEGGLMIDLSPMKAVLVDPETRRARCQPGASWGEFNRQTQLHGLACTGGIVSSTGVAGLTLGGGIGWLMGRFGLALDNLVRAEVVDANGEVLTVSESSHPDLFWALRGGGGNFGVVTCFEFELHPFGPMLLGGPVIHPIQATRDVLCFYRDFVAAGLPDELVVHAGLQHHPDGSGRPVAVMFAAHSGEAAEAELAPIRAFGQPLEDGVAPIAYCDLNAMLDAAFPRGARNYWRSSMMRELRDEAIEALLEAFQTIPSQMSGILLEHLHGAHSRVEPTATAYPHRSDGFNLLLYGQWTDPKDDGRNIGWVREQHRALARFFETAAYSNYLTSDEGEDRIRQAYGVNFDRLRSIKARYDPENVFHLNQNIPPG